MRSEVKGTLKVIKTQKTKAKICIKDSLRKKPYKTEQKQTNSEKQR